jgi:hypothetical protein
MKSAHSSRLGELASEITRKGYFERAQHPRSASEESMEPTGSALRSRLHRRSVVGIRSCRVVSSQPCHTATRCSIRHGFTVADHWSSAHRLFRCAVVRRYPGWPVPLELHCLVHPSIPPRIATRSRRRLARFICTRRKTYHYLRCASAYRF